MRKWGSAASRCCSAKVLARLLVVQANALRNFEEPGAGVAICVGGHASRLAIVEGHELRVPDPLAALEKFVRQPLAADLYLFLSVDSEQSAPWRVLQFIEASQHVRSVVWDSFSDEDLADVGAALERGHAWNTTWLSRVTRKDGRPYREYLLFDQWRRCYETIEDVEDSIGQSYAYVGFMHAGFLWMAEHPPLAILEAGRCGSQPTMWALDDESFGGVGCHYLFAERPGALAVAYLWDLVANFGQMDELFGLRGQTVMQADYHEHVSLQRLVLHRFVSQHVCMRFMTSVASVVPTHGAATPNAMLDWATAKEFAEIWHAGAAWENAVADFFLMGANCGGLHPDCCSLGALTYGGPTGCWRSSRLHSLRRCCLQKFVAVTLRPPRAVASRVAGQVRPNERSAPRKQLPRSHDLSRVSITLRAAPRLWCIPSNRLDNRSFCGENSVAFAPIGSCLCYDVDRLLSAALEITPAVANPTIQVVVLILSMPKDAARRSYIRGTIPELTMHVRTPSCAASVEVLFVVCRKQPRVLMPSLWQRVLRALLAERRRFGDLAFIPCRDGLHRNAGGQHNGKVWQLFAWAALRRPGADLVFKQDDDTLVDWRIALPRLTRRAGADLESCRKPEGLYMGRLCEQCGHKELGHCGAGELYGFSHDIVRWIATRMVKFKIGIEDMLACRWAREFEREHHTSLDWRGLLPAPDYHGAWIHNLKDLNSYQRCFEDRRHGCVSFDPEKVKFKLPASTATVAASSSASSPNFDANTAADMRKLSNLSLLTISTDGSATLASQDGWVNAHMATLGKRRPWTSSKTKVDLIKAHLDAMYTDGGNQTELIAFVDGFDVAWGGCSREAFEQAYWRIVARTQGAKIVFGAELTCNEQDCDRVPRAPVVFTADGANGYQAQVAIDLDAGFWTPYASCARTWHTSKGRGGCAQPPALKFLNSGFFMGPLNELREMLHWADQHYGNISTWGDQSVFAEYWLRHGSTVTLDYTAELVINLSDLREDALHVLTSHRSHGGNDDGKDDMPYPRVWNRAFSRLQCFIHGNGRGKRMWFRLVHQLFRGRATGL